MTEWCDFSVNLVVGCTGACPWCYARELNDKYHFVEDFSKPTNFPMRACYLSGVEGNAVLMDPLSDIAQWPKSSCDGAAMAMAANPDNTYLFLTRSPHEASHALPWTMLKRTGINCHLGYSATSASELCELGPSFSFVSIEPMLTPMADFEGFLRANPTIEWVTLSTSRKANSEMWKTSPEWVGAVESACETVGVPLFMDTAMKDIIEEDSFRREYPSWHTSYTPAVAKAALSC